MTLVYIPTPITSAEQAEKLPVGTVATHERWTPREKFRAEHGGVHWHHPDEGLTDADMVGWSALVPVEAEEEWSITADVLPRSAVLETEDEARAAAADWGGGSAERRFVTPWEEA